jgi:hypothetical protein
MPPRHRLTCAGPGHSTSTILRSNRSVDATEEADRRADVNHQPAPMLLCRQPPGNGSGSTNGINGDRTTNLNAPPRARGRVNASAGRTDRALRHPSRIPLGASLNTAANALDPRLTRSANNKYGMVTGPVPGGTSRHSHRHYNKA